ncbi:DUF3025 domain-containing protein [Oligella urethralis]|uniref:Protein of uncharacterized function (DUF3025) n=2 Tax=Oligella urethralis TaxID=90245 RepID=A0A2X1UTP2_9BURK|nr:DUF3025 domain-containing protein [Oligella urethralis]SPY07811.1 Protein of uncharacterised function (DUF3025) [Oligella urethralis]
MLLPELRDLDLSPPYYDHWRAFIETTLLEMAKFHSVSELLNHLKASDFTKHFVPQAALPVGVAYESFIYDTDGVPTRDGPHDYFNALCWFLFTHSKSQLNRVQAAQIRQDGVYQQRGAVRDAITIIDENGLLLACSDSLWEALAQKQWQRAFVALREEWQHSQAVIFGHALMEKLLKPYKGICAHVIRIPPPMGTLDLNVVDRWLSAFLSADKLATKPYIPVPIFGIPGWHPQQQAAGFYEDKTVFRPPRIR